MSSGVRLLISGVAGFATILLSLIVGVLAGSNHWPGPLSGIPLWGGLVLGIVVRRLALMRRYAPHEMVGELPRLK